MKKQVVVGRLVHSADQLAWFVLPNLNGFEDQEVERLLAQAAQVLAALHVRLNDLFIDFQVLNSPELFELLLLEENDFCVLLVHYGPVV